SSGRLVLALSSSLISLRSILTTALGLARSKRTISAQPRDRSPPRTLSPRLWGFLVPDHHFDEAPQQLSLSPTPTDDPAPVGASRSQRHSGSSGPQRSPLTTSAPGSPRPSHLPPPRPHNRP